MNILLQYEAKVDYVDGDGMSPLGIAASQGHSRVSIKPNWIDHSLASISLPLQFRFRMAKLKISVTDSAKIDSFARFEFQNLLLSFKTCDKLRKCLSTRKTRVVSTSWNRQPPLIRIPLLKNRQLQKRTGVKNRTKFSPSGPLPFQ